MSEKLKIVFMGTPEFAVPSLELLVKNGYDIAAVVTAPDKPSGRGLKLAPSAVKKYADSARLKVLQPVNLKDAEWIEELRSLQANLHIVVAFRMLPEAVWRMPKLGTFNLHASLLPQYRGAAPINWAIINGEKETGITTFFLQHEIDTGEIIFQEKIPVTPEETAGELHDKIMMEGARLVLKTVQSIEKKDYILKSQEESAGSLDLKTAPKISRETCRLKRELSVTDAYNLVRGLSPRPAAFAEIKNMKSNELLLIKILRAAIHEHPPGHSPGVVETDNKTTLSICLKDGSLDITELQAAGKSAMPVKDFLNGFKFQGSWSLV